MPNKIDKAELARAEAVVAAGAEYLDARLPGWFVDVNVRTLDLSSGCSCVLGQLATDIVPRKSWAKAVTRFGRFYRPDFGDAKRTLRLNGNRCRKLGFLCVDDHYDSDVHCMIYRPADEKITYPALNRAWRKLIRRRLEGEN